MVAASAASVSRAEATPRGQARPRTEEGEEEEEGAASHPTSRDLPHNARGYRGK